MHCGCHGCCWESAWHYPPYAWTEMPRGGGPPWARGRFVRPEAPRAAEREALRERVQELREEIDAIERRLASVEA